MVYTSEKFYFNTKNYSSQKLRNELIGKTIIGNFFCFGVNKDGRVDLKKKIIEIKYISSFKNNCKETIYKIIDKNNKSYYTKHTRFLIISDLLNHFNNKKPYILFYGMNLNIKFKFFRKILDKIRSILNLSQKYYIENKFIEVKLKEIYHDDDKLFIIDKNNIIYSVYNPNCMTSKIFSENDPYGEEDWDD